MRKAKEAVASKKNDQGEMPNSSKSKDKRKGEDEQVKSPKKQKSGPVENKDPLPKYINYHSLTAPLDHIYVVINRRLYKSPEPIKGDRARRAIKRNCAFHKDITNTTDRYVALKDKIERLIRACHFKEFIDEPQTANREEQP